MRNLYTRRKGPAAIKDIFDNIRDDVGTWRPGTSTRTI